MKSLASDSTCLYNSEGFDTASYPSLDHDSTPGTPQQVPPPSPTFVLPHGRPKPNYPLCLPVSNHNAASCSSAITSRTNLVPSPEEPISADRPNYARRKEKVGNTLNTNSNFLKQLLPRERLPFPVDKDLLQKLSAPVGSKAPIWNALRSCFCQSPTNFGQAAICDCVRGAFLTYYTPPFVYGYHQSCDFFSCIYILYLAYGGDNIVLSRFLII